MNTNRQAFSSAMWGLKSNVSQTALLLFERHIDVVIVDQVCLFFDILFFVAPFQVLGTSEDLANDGRCQRHWPCSGFFHLSKFCFTATIQTCY